MIADEGCAARGCPMHDSKCTPGVEMVVKKEWQGLTMEEADNLVKEFGGWSVDMVGHVMVFAVEDALKEKNT